MKRAVTVAAVLFAGLVFAPHLASFLAGAAITGVGGFMILLQAGEKREHQIVQQTQNRCKDDLVAYAEGMAAASQEDAEEPVFPREDRRRASDVLGAWA
ncbi:hypothetical protein [Tsukamurella paurometabola]|uniref:Uncharacterized protein n=1 Tax=Tsukamurella paurometabola TaxID=2061 RepID=A0ABS5NEM3_TSUPA|nr:hypothetical protein [Tsukamurella paurometabola]MBS4102393.1 hypothetical protein [Tsukamurella paurometabola]